MTHDTTPPRWWDARAPTFRRTVRAVVTWMITGLFAVTFGVATATYTGSIGPHVAVYTTTLNGEVTFNMGPLGSLIIESPIPANIGANVVVGQIPDELAIDGNVVDVGSDQAVAALTTDLANYMQFFTSPQEAIRSATHGMVTDAVGRAVLMWSILLTVVLIGRLSAHGIFRTATLSAWQRPGVAPLVVTLTIIGIALPVLPATQGSAGAGSVSQVLAGTPLENARITGRLGALIDHYGQAIVAEVEENEEFYEIVAQNAQDAFDSDPAPTAPVGTPLAMPSLEQVDLADTSETSVEDVPDAGGDPDVDARLKKLDEQNIDVGEDQPLQPTPQVSETLPPEPASASRESDPVTMVVISDLHCNIGMGKVTGVVAQIVDADLIVNLGDSVIGGTSVEGVCINAFADSFGETPVISSDGNHDSAETADQERARGWHVLDGDPINVAGIRFLGDTDPTLTSLGAPTKLIADENIAERGTRLTERACQEEAAGQPIDIFMMHNPRATEEALDSGCIRYALAGHYHRRIGPWQRGLGVQYIHTSSAGATVNNPTIGPLQGPAGVTVLRWDRANNVPLSMRVMRAMPDKSVELSPWYRWPSPSEDPVHLDWPSPEDSPWP